MATTIAKKAKAKKTARRAKPETDLQVWVRRAEKLVALDGTELEHARVAIRAGLAKPHKKPNHAGENHGALADALHCMTLVEDHLGHARGCRVGVSAPAEAQGHEEPEVVLEYLAAAAAHIEEVLDNVGGELDLLPKGRWMP